MNFKKSKIYKVLSALMIQGVFVSNTAFAITAKTYKKSFGEKVEDAIYDHMNIIGTILGVAIIVYYFIKLRKKLDESKKKKEYPSEENQNEVSKTLKDTQRGYIVDYFFTFLIGLIIIVLSLIIYE